MSSQTLHPDPRENKLDLDGRALIKAIKAIPSIEDRPRITVEHWPRKGGLRHFSTCDVWGEPHTIHVDLRGGEIEVWSGWSAAYWRSGVRASTEIAPRVLQLLALSLRHSKRHAKARESGDHSRCCELRRHALYRTANVSTVALACVNAAARGVGIPPIIHSADLLAADDAFQGRSFDREPRLHAFSRIANCAALGDSDRLLAHMALNIYEVLSPGQDPLVDTAKHARVKAWEEAS